MKANRLILVLLVALMAIPFISCSKSTPADTSAPAESSMPAASVVEGGSYVMLQGLGLWTKDGDTLKYAKAATLGDQVAVLGDPTKFTVDKAEREYTLVRGADGKEFYIRSPYAVAAKELAIVQDAKCVLYNEPRVIQATKTIVPRLTVVAIIDGEITAEGFIKISYANADQVMVAEKWVKRETLAIGFSNIQSVVALIVAQKMPESSKDLKINILEETLKSYPGSDFYADINNALLALRGALLPELVSEAASMLVNFDSVNVRSSPDAVSGAVIGQLNTGDMVETVERSASSVTIDGLTDFWYHISSPMDGWVFGASISKP